MKNSIISKLFLCLLMTSPLLLASDVDMRADSDTEHVASSGGSGSGSGHYAAGAGGAGAGTQGFGLVDPDVSVGLDISGEKDDSCSVDALIVETLGGGSGSGSYAALDDPCDFSDLEGLPKALDVDAGFDIGWAGLGGSGSGVVGEDYDAFIAPEIKIKSGLNYVGLVPYYENVEEFVQKSNETTKEEEEKKERAQEALVFQRLLEFGTGSFAANHLIKEYLLDFESSFINTLNNQCMKLRSIGPKGSSYEGRFICALSGDFVVARSDRWDRNGQLVYVINYKTGNVVFMLPTIRGTARYCICALTENRFLVRLGSDFEIWNAETQVCERVIRTHASVFLDKGRVVNGDLVACGKSIDNQVVVQRIDLATGAMKNSVDMIDCKDISFFEDGSFVSLGIYGNLTLHAFNNDNTVISAQADLGNCNVVIEKSQYSKDLKDLMRQGKVSPIDLTVWASDLRRAGFLQTREVDGLKGFVCIVGSCCVIYPDINNVLKVTVASCLSDDKKPYNQGGSCVCLSNGDVIFRSLSNSALFRVDKLDMDKKCVKATMIKGVKKAFPVKAMVELSNGDLAYFCHKTKIWVLDCNSLKKALLHEDMKLNKVMTLLMYLKTVDKKEQARVVRGVVRGLKTVNRLLDQERVKLLKGCAGGGIGEEVGSLRKSGKNKKDKGKGKARSNKRRRK